MASIAQMVSELAHSVGQPNNKALRENLRLLIIHTRNEVVRRSYENHNYIDKSLTQRFNVRVVDVPDGDIELPTELNFENDGDSVAQKINLLDVKTIKRTVHKVPKPVRLINNTPFDRVSSIGAYTNKVFPFIKEGNVRFRNSLPGMSGTTSYDYINGYIYLFPPINKVFELNKIQIEGAFELPTEIQVMNKEVDGWDAYLDYNEYLMSEDMIGQIKDIIYKRDLLSTYRETNEIPNIIKY